VARDLCSAAQAVFAVTDRGGAEAYLGRQGAAPGTVVTRLGEAGGYSTMMARVEDGLDTVELLTGVIADGRHGNATGMMNDFRRREPWVGERMWGGASVIPVRAPYRTLAVAGFALIGDAGCQVFPAHGSGVGAGLVAARLLADAVATHGAPGSPNVAQAYERAFWKNRGRVHVAYDLLRRGVQRLGTRGVASLMSSPLMRPNTARASLDQRLINGA
jgi:flavin-dependent dehydrogenase